MKAANAARFRERCQQDFEAFRRERLASGELECQRLINAAQQHLTQVLPALLHRTPPQCGMRA